MVSTRIAIAWHGLPMYAARALKYTVSRLDYPVDILATKGPDSADEIEELLGQRVTWLTPEQAVSWADLRLKPPDVLFYTGWAFKAFNCLAEGTRRHGGKLVSMVDNSRKSNLRQKIGKLYFKLQIDPKVDHYLVPGFSARSLLQYFDVPANRIREGMYGADSAIFSPGPPLNQRGIEFVFVGQFIPRKGVRHLIDAVQLLRSTKKDSKFVALGDGPLKNELVTAGFEVLPFSSCQVVARQLRNSRFLVLPSLEDHWGVVVHEAALSGCGLILSANVGSRHEFASEENSWIFEPGDPTDLAAALNRALQMGPPAASDCQAMSLNLANRFGPERSFTAFRSIIQSLF